MLDGPVSLDLPGDPLVFTFWPPDPATDSVPSRFTGKPLGRIRYELGVRGDEAHEQLNAALKAATDGGTPIPDADGRYWDVVEHRISFQAGQTVTIYRHDVLFREHEELDLQRVEFADLAITPDRFELSSNDDRLVLRFTADLTSEQHQQFDRTLEQWIRDGQPYFPVQMTGITDKPIQMRFGQRLWQPLGAGAARHLITLVGEGEETPGFRLGETIASLHQPEIDRLQERSLIAKAALDALLDELQQAGQLDAAAIQRIRDKSDITKIPFAEWRDFERANNVDNFFD